MSQLTAVRYEQAIPDIFKALADVEAMVAQRDFDRNLYHLVKLRASQMNGCAFCVKMHLREARRDEETNDRLDRLVVWEHVDDFDAREKAALAWTEALTVLDNKTDYEALRVRLREHFSEDQIGTLTAIVAMINLWNRFKVSQH